MFNNLFCFENNKKHRYEKTKKSTMVCSVYKLNLHLSCTLKALFKQNDN